MAHPEIAETPAATILPLAEALHSPSGGKAEGLARLIALGLRVPAGFVVRSPGRGALSRELLEAYRALGGGAVAVRSSAADEDGALASFAGQFESCLEVEGEQALRQAIDRCLASLESSRSQRYRRDRERPASAASMNVVIQRMVRARTAGVLFTVDPVGGRPELLVDAVPGLGEALVAGRATPDHYRLARDGRLLGFEPRATGEAPLLGEEALRELREGALRAEAAAGVPLDLEWAIDEQGLLYWLQARPVTALPAPVDPLDSDDELDTRARPGAVYTRANVGEMLPGAQTPLTLSTTVVAVDQGIQRMLVACGGASAREPALRTLGVFQGHLFFNLSSMLDFTRKVGGSNVEALTFAICGRRIPELVAPPAASPILRAINGARYLRFVLKGADEVTRLEQLLSKLRIPETGSGEELYLEIDRQLPALHDAFAIHLQASASSGLTHGALHGVLARGGLPTPEHEATLAALLEDAGGVESAELVRELDRVRDAIARAPGARAGFVEATPDAAERWLRDQASSGAAGIAYAGFLARHGHRAARELAMEQSGWRDEPRPLILSLQAALAAPPATARRAREPVKLRQGLALRALVAWARSSVRQRERSKSLLIQACDVFKRAYRALARALCAEGLLAEEAELFFLEHAELGRLIASRGRSRHAELARIRRDRHRRQQRLSFPDVFVGAPTPLAEPEPGDSAGGSVLQGRPVSRGIARGKARVVLELEGARAIQPGEILIAPITDIGWSPYFHLIAGLATDVGSAISHGAVVAREYGLPAVVNLRIASRVIRTGERVVLDGERGTLRREAPDEP